MDMATFFMGALVVVLIIGVPTAAILFIRYIVNSITNKATDAVSNALKERKNKKEAGKTENLADRYSDKNN